MIKFFALNLMFGLFLSSCSHSGHHQHHVDKAHKPCKVGEKCDETKKAEQGCCDKKEKTESCCKDEDVKKS